ncbi:MAG: hypothetical protein QOD06_663 [Candidatus Binatota bacterium]|jgi:HEAT repeat protein|nr:hypothetical protein [Candidatus Binatota bacterium]
MAIDLDLHAEELLPALLSDEDARRLYALQALLESDRAGPLDEVLVSALLDCLGHSRKAVQRTAAEVLALWSSATGEIRSRLEEMLRAADFRSRWGAAFALAKIGPSPRSLPVLLETLGQADGDMRWAAASIIVALARREAAIREKLVELVGGGSAAQQKMAIYCLRDAGEGGEALRAALLGALGSDASGVRLAALSAVTGLFAADAEVVSPVVQVAREDPDPGVRRAAVSALGNLTSRTPDVESVLAAAEASDDAGLRKAADGARRRRG